MSPATKIPVARILQEFQTMADENWTYVWGGAKKGKVDCSGAFCYVYDLFSLKIDHGSNSIARKFIRELLPISEAKPGMAAFKCKAWTESEADKKNKWYGTEPGNVSHIGLVGQNGDTVLHASGVNKGFVESKLDSTWKFVGYLNDVAYDEAAAFIFGNATVNTAKTELNIRESPDAKSREVGEVAKGGRLLVTDKPTDGWYSVVMENGVTGFAYSKYVKLDEGFKLPIYGDSYEIPGDEVTNGTDLRIVIEDEAGNRFYPVGSFRAMLVSECID